MKNLEAKILLNPFPGKYIEMSTCVKSKRRKQTKLKRGKFSLFVFIKFGFFLVWFGNSSV